MYNLAKVGKWAGSFGATAIAIGLVVGVATLSEKAYSANSWFSKMRTSSTPGVFTTGDISEISSLAASTSTRSVFDIVISLYEKTGDTDYPSGDDDASVDAGASDDEQNAYEEIIQHFADAVCEQTNGQHHLGTVRIFKRGGQQTKADIIWKPSEHPQANPSGFGRNGAHIYMGDVFGSVNFLSANERDAGGYTLGHEWGHYTLGLYDEYVGNAETGAIYLPRSTDVPPPNPAIMNSQWGAAQNRGGDFNALNHSQKQNFSVQTAQGRVYGKSGWEVLTQDTKDDPKTGKPADYASGRVHYSNLDGAAPAEAPSDDPPNYDIELPAERATCRNDLEIIWATDDIEFQLVIDRSGSMLGTPMDNIKQAGKTLVDLVTAGKTALGLVSFSSTVSQDQAITPIPAAPDDAAVRSAIKTTIDGLNASGSTAMFDAAASALTNLEIYANSNGTDASQLVFLLTDGQDNASSQTQASVTAAYLAADVPLNTFGYGSFAPTGVLSQLADDTGGVFSQSPTTLSEIQFAFNQALAATTSTLSVGADAPTASPGEVATLTFQVDDTLDTLTLFATYQAAQSDVVLSVDSPAGAVTTNFDCTEVVSDTTCTTMIDHATVMTHGLGEWMFVATNNTSANLDVNLSVLAAPLPGDVFDVSVDTVSGSTVTYPEPIRVTAAVSKGFPIINAAVEATVTDPLGTVTSLAMNDHGSVGDAIANDGIYSAIFGYAWDGVYSIDVKVNNNTRTAKFSLEGASPSHVLPSNRHALAPNPDGSQPTPPSLPPITQNFTRTGFTQVQVQGLSGDDHANSAFGATPLLDDNSDVIGNIDFAGDVDFFEIFVTDQASDLVVRVTNLGLGMNPWLTVFGSDANTVVDSGTIADAQTANGYVAITVPAGELDTKMYAKVEHVDSSASQGSYAISAGQALFSDQTGTPPVLVAAVLPSSRSVKVGTPATAFLTLINNGASEAIDIRTILASVIPVDFVFQTTDPNTNAIVGTRNAPVSIPSGESQTFVIALTPAAAVAPTEARFGFEGFNTAQGQTIPGVNTLFFSASDTPIPDIIALAATLNNDGIVNIPANSGTGVFAVATTNVGVSESITVTAYTGSVRLPVSISLCETNPSTGVCRDNVFPPTSTSVTTQIGAGASPTFGVFVQGNADVPFDPAMNRIFVEFKDAGGDLRGSTSVAVRTQ